jgi:hypothetical protein
MVVFINVLELDFYVVLVTVSLHTYSTFSPPVGLPSEWGRACALSAVNLVVYSPSAAGRFFVRSISRRPSAASECIAKLRFAVFIPKINSADRNAVPSRRRRGAGRHVGDT